jgi:hypothetical protein
MGLNRSGFSFVELMMASAITVISLFGVSTAFRVFSNAIRYSQILNQAISLESQITSDLRDPLFMAIHRQALLSTGKAPNLKILIDGNKVAAPDETVKMDTNFKPCSNNPSSCALESQLAIQCQLINAHQMCMAAYRIQSLNSKIPISGFGAKGVGAFQNEDYTVQISFDQYLRAEVGACSEGVMTGFNRYTGEVYCATSGGASCPSDSFLQGYSVSGGAITPNCLKPPTVSCPYPYVATSATFYPNPSAECVFVTQNSGPMMAPWVPAPSVTIEACPSKYYNVVGNGSCTVTNLNVVQGVCVDPMGNTTLVDPPPPTVTQSVVGGVLSCTVTPSVGPCGGSASGDASWSGTCVLKVPENVQGS